MLDNSLGEQFMMGFGQQNRAIKTFHNHYLTLTICLIIIINGFFIITPTAQSKESSGSDSFGYRWIDSNLTAPSINYNWIDGISGSTDLNLVNDDNSGYINLGFIFPFYSGLYNSIAICDNGWASFTDSSYTTSAGNPPPYSGRPNAIIAPFWLDLNPTISGSVTYKRNNLTLPKHFIITWNSIPINYGVYQYNQTFQAILYENGTILFQYKSINITKSNIPMVGIEDSSGTIGLNYLSTSIENESAVRFYYYFPEHDMNVKSVSVKKYAKLNQEIEIKTYIENFGLKDESGVNVSLVINNQPVQWTGNTINLSTYQGTEVKFNWRPTTQGNHSVGIKIENVSGEDKTDNNFLEKTVDVRAWRGIVYYDDRHSAMSDEYYSIWFDELKKNNIWVSKVYNTRVDSDVLKEYTVYLAAYPYYEYNSNEINAIHNFIDSGKGMFLLNGYNDYSYLDGLTNPYEIEWERFNNYISGTYNDIKKHEITNNVKSVSLNSHRVNLTVKGAAKALIFDDEKTKGIKLAISNESGSGRVACFTDPYAFYDWDINQANNKLLSTQIFDWVIGDNKPPIRPRNFRASDGKLGNQINLSWTPNTEIDLNGYFLYRGTTSGSYEPNPIFIPAPASKYNDKGPHLKDHTEYFYKLAAADEVPNISNFTFEVKATPTDQFAPRTPHNFTIKDVGTGKLLNISWNKNKESDVVKYNLLKSDSFEFDEPELFIFNPNETYYLDSDVVEGNTYFYRISVVDEVPNESKLTPIKDGTPYDRISPLQPTGFNVVDPGLGNTLLLTWNQSSDEDLVDYLIERKDPKKNIEKIYVSVPATMYYDNQELIDGVTYSYRLYARDDSKLRPPNKSPPTNWYSATPTDITPPMIPENFSIRDESYFTPSGPVHMLNLTWNISNDNDLRGFILYRFNFKDFKTLESRILVKLNVVNYYRDYDVEEGVDYFYKITAFDEIPNESPASVEQKGIPKDVSPPPMPKEFKVEPLLEGESVKINWALQPGSETEGFRLFYKENLTDDFILLSELKKSENKFIHSGLTNDKPYYYTLQSYDIVPNFSPFTAVRKATPSDRLPPKKPTGLKVETMDIGKSLKLSWKPNTEPDLMGYRIYRDGNLIMTVDKNTTSVIDKSNDLKDGVAYRFNITAIDEVPNESDSSTIKVGVPEDNIAPSTPEGFGVSLSSNKDKVILSWTPSNDSDIENYLIYRSTNNNNFNLIAIISYTENTFYDSSVIDGETYYYKIASTDNASNISPKSNDVKINVPKKEDKILGDISSSVGIGLVILIIIILLIFLFFKNLRKRKKTTVEEKQKEESIDKQGIQKQVVTQELPMARPGITPTFTHTQAPFERGFSPIEPGSASAGIPPTQKQFPIPLQLPSNIKPHVYEHEYEPQKIPEPGEEPVRESERSGTGIETQKLPIFEKQKPMLPPSTITTTPPSTPAPEPTESQQIEVRPQTQPHAVQKQESIRPLPLSPPDLTRPLPTILIPLDADKETLDIQGMKRDKKGRVTILNPKLFYVPKSPLKNPPVGKIVKHKKSKNN